MKCYSHCWTWRSILRYFYLSGVLDVCDYHPTLSWIELMLTAILMSKVIMNRAQFSLCRLVVRRTSENRSQDVLSGPLETVDLSHTMHDWHTTIKAAPPSTCFPTRWLTGRSGSALYDGCYSPLGTRPHQQNLSAWLRLFDGHLSPPRWFLTSSVMDKSWRSIFTLVKK